MMEGVRTWLMSVLAVSLICAAAQALLPKTGSGQAGRLVCGLALLCGVLQPLTGGGELSPGNWSLNLEGQQLQLEQQVQQEMCRIIEARCAAYSQDRAAQFGIQGTIQIDCREEQPGVYLPDRMSYIGPISAENQAAFSACMYEELGIPLQRQSYQTEEDGR